MPPKAQKKPAAPKKPTKPSAKSKTGNTACSQAASNWQLAIRGKEPLDPQTYSTLAKCRAMTRTAKQADDRARMGYNLNEQGAAALKGRLQKRFDQGLITQKSRDERLKTLLQQRKEKQANKTRNQVNSGKNSDLTHEKGVRAAADLAGVSIVGAKNLKKADKALQEASVLPLHRKVGRLNTSDLRNEFNAKRSPVIGDSWALSDGTRVEVIKINPRTIIGQDGKKKYTRGSVVDLSIISKTKGRTISVYTDKNVDSRGNTLSVGRNTQERSARALQLLNERKAKQAAVTAKPAKQADSIGTAESYIGNAIQSNRYADRLKSNPSAMAAFRQTTLDKWKSGVLEQAKTGRLSDDILDSYEAQFGRGSVGKTFRGVYEKGAAGYFTKDIRTNQKPADKAADLVKKVRELPKYTLAKSRAKANQKKISDLMSNPQDFLVQRGKYRSENATYANRFATERFRGKNAVADAISDLKERRRERAEGDLTLGQRRAMQKPTDKAASLVSSVRQKPGYGVARASAAGNRELVGLKMRDKGTVTTQPAFTLKQSSSQGGTGAGRKTGLLFQTEGTALDKAAQAGQKAPLPGQTGLFESENKTGKPPEYVVEAGFTTWKQVNKYGLNNIVKDAPSIAKAAVDPTRNKYAGGSRGWIENDIASRIVKMTRIHGNKQLAIKAVAREYEVQSQRQQEPGMSEVYKSISSELYKSSDLANYKLNSQPQPPKPAFSRQGQLAPGRGTEERKKAAGILQNLRSRNNDGRALARTIRNDAVFTRRWNDKKHLISSDAGFKSRRILEQSYQQRVNAEAGYTDAQHAANKLVTKTGKVKESAIREANIEYGSNRGLKQNAIARRLGSLRDSASYHLNNYRMLKQAGVSETSYIGKPKPTKEFLKNPLSRLRNALTNRNQPIPEVPQWAKDYRSPKTATPKPQPAPKQQGYNPETAVEKTKSGWWAKASDGTYFPTPFKTRKEALSRTRLHSEVISAKYK